MKYLPKRLMNMNVDSWTLVLRKLSGLMCTIGIRLLRKGDAMAEMSLFAWLVE